MIDKYTLLLFSNFSTAMSNKRKKHKNCILYSATLKVHNGQGRFQSFEELAEKNGLQKEYPNN